MQALFAGRRRRVLRLALRAYDVLVLAGAVIASWLAASAPGAAGCPAFVLALPPLVLAACALALGMPRGRFRYGSAADLAATGVAGAAAGIAAVAAWILAGHCGAWLLASWLAPLLLIATPRALAAVLIGPEQEEPSALAPVVRRATTAAGGRTAWIITLSRPADEPRVRRQADALHHGGWNVVAVGYKGVAPAPSYWTLVELPAGLHPGRRMPSLAEFFTLGPLVKLVVLVMARFSGDWAERYYWMEGRHAENFNAILQTARTAGLACDLIAHHDVDSLGIAARLSSELGVPFTTDAHEYARGQYMHSVLFRLLTTHYVHSLQQRLFPRAALLTIVCEGIAELIAAEYPLRRPPLVVRNVSFYEPMPFRATGERILVTYHGIVYPTRGIEEAIRSLPLWRGEFELVIRGPGPDDYIESLRRLARREGVEARVHFARVVPLTDLVSAANECDIGFFGSPDYSPQKRFTAPNKLFEYLMAGLALCVSDLPEMRRVVVAHDLGRLFTSLEPATIAAAINGFTRESIDRYKRRALEAAKVLCWEHERKPLIDAYAEIPRAGAFRTSATR